MNTHSYSRALAVGRKAIKENRHIPRGTGKTIRKESDKTNKPVKTKG